MRDKNPNLNDFFIIVDRSYISKEFFQFTKVS